jgi:bifunctional UDP-N-acetylglucosamine pyrophosphorylase/glucosamine-1-phosphate N-acetyltransferase
MDLTVVVLAAGKGTRMHSSKPKLLHTIGGKPMVQHVVECAAKLTSSPIKVVINSEILPELQKLLADFLISWVIQEPQLGTGDAVLQAIKGVTADRILTLYGDVPLITQQSLNLLLNETPAGQVGVITATPKDPTGLGRIIRNGQEVVRIVEERDATPDERKINEINTGIFCLPGATLEAWLSSIKTNNAQNEYYLTDVVSIAKSAGVKVKAVAIEDTTEVLGVNNRVQLAHCERAYQSRIAHQLMLQGVTLIDPARVDFRGALKIGRDVTIDINTVFEGNVVLGDRVSIGPNCVLRNVKIGDDTKIKSHCVLEDCSIETQAMIGPFARLRPGAVIESHVHVGNFVEIKNSTLATGVKVNHLSYIGDTKIGERTNIGAGTITANYDGVNKHHTMIGKDVSIGSNSVLVAPIEVGDDATIGAGSVVTKFAPGGQLTLGRAPQTSIPKWKRPKKQDQAENE